MKVKTIIVDLDRTLLRTDKTVSPYTAEVLRKCKERGIGIMVATARPLRAIKSYCEVIDFDAMVVSNGARVIWGEKRKEYGICTKSAEHLLKNLKNDPTLRITLETGDCAYSNKRIKAMLEIGKYLPDEAIYFGDDYDDIEPIKMCGAGVAVSNAIEEVKAIADYVTESNDEDGVAKFMEQVLQYQCEK